MSYVTPGFVTKLRVWKHLDRYSLADSGGWVDVKHGSNAIGFSTGDWKTCKLLRQPLDSCLYQRFGFNASTGWDAVTGLGTPDFGRLLGLLAD
jgi:hypothetical protein|eukprot:COSAG01_NODE_1232_length_11111_cov_24.710770_16_plen_93_part_00